jgi:hypothetical protein
MNRILAILALASFAPATAFGQAFNTTGGYGNGVVNAAGAQYVDVEGKKPTYSYAPAAAVTPAATATDVVVLTGSASKTIRVIRACLDASAGTPGPLTFALTKHTTADTGGTSTAGAATQHDSNDPAPSGTVALYSANPTVGTATTIQSGVIWATGAGVKDWRCFTFGDIADEKIVLRGVAQQFAITHLGTAIPGTAAVHYKIEWSEALD